VECLSANVTKSATLAQEVSDCLAATVNAIYFEVFLDPHSDESSLWAFSFRSYFVVVDTTVPALYSFFPITLCEKIIIATPVSK
jgi:hypothetical protein